VEPAEVADRLEIGQLLVAYSEAVDRRDWDALDDVFTPDAVIDYTELGGIRGDLEAIKGFLRSSLGEESGKLGFMHLLGQARVVIDGDVASARTPCLNPMVLRVPAAERCPGDDREHVYFCGLWYRDELVRTPGGWRIRDRYEERAYKFNRPDWAPTRPVQ